MFKKLFQLFKAPGYSLTPKKKKYDKESNSLAKTLVLGALFKKDTLYSVMMTQFLYVFIDRDRQFFYSTIQKLVNEGLIEKKRFGFIKVKSSREFLHLSTTDKCDKAIYQIMNEDGGTIDGDLYKKIKTKIS